MILERAKFLLKDTALYGTANGLSRFMTFLTIPVIVKHIDVSEFGVWNLLTILGSVIAGVAIMGMDSAVVRFYYEDESQERRNKVFSNGLFIQLTLIAVLVFFGSLAPQWLLKPVAVDERYAESMYYVLGWIPGYVITQYCQNWFKWTFQRFHFLIISLGTGATQLIVLGIFATYGQLNLHAILITQAVATWTFAIVALWWCRGNIVAQFDKNLAGKLMHFGFPMMLVLLASLLAPALDRLFLVRFLSTVQLGIYSFSQKLSIIMMVAVTAFQTAFGPFSYSIWEQSDARETFSRFHSYYIVGAGIIALGICCCTGPLILLFGTSEYLESGSYLPFLVMGALVYGMYSFAALGFFYARKMLLNLMALCVGLVVNLILNFVLIPGYGEYGAVVGYLSGNIAMVLVGYLFSARYYNIGYSFIRDAVLVATTFCLMLASAYTNFYSQVYLDALTKLFIFLPGLLLIAFLLLPPGDKDFVKRLILRR